MSSGALQGTFGRDYVPVAGCALIGFLGRGARSFSFGAPLVLAVAMLYICIELYVWVHEVMPFFQVYD